MRKISNLEASRTINYKDALTITGRLDVIQEFPLIPGVVTACGLALPKFESLLGDAAR
jgi:NADPH:quinone reductase-like Zn-dependent oxidoreductase